MTIPAAIPLVYIAGPFRGPTPWHVRKHVEAARDIGLYVAQLGAYPVIPHTMTADFDKQLDDQFWLDGTMALLARCDAIYLLPTWEQSTGARAEREFALYGGLNIGVFYHGLELSERAFQEWVRIRRNRMIRTPAG